MGTTRRTIRTGCGTPHGRLLAAGLTLALTLGACADDGSETDGTLIDPIRPTTVPPPDDLGPGISEDGTDEGDVVGGGSGTGAGTGSGPGVGVPSDEESPLEDGPLEDGPGE